MPRRKVLTQRQLDKLPTRKRRYSLPDPVQPGLIIRVSPSGLKSFTVVERYRKPFQNGRQVWRVVGDSSFMSLDEARGAARGIVRKIRLNLPLDEAPEDSLGDVANKWLKDVHERGYRTAKEIERVVRKFLTPTLGDYPFASVKRSDLTRVLDNVAATSGKAQANAVLRQFSALAGWHSARTDGYVSPVANVRGMRRGAIVKRSRILSDDEIRGVWVAADSPEFRLVPFALVCGQRHTKIAEMTWDDLDGDTWIIPEREREKTTGGILRLPKLARQILERQPHIVGRPIFGPMRNQTLNRLRTISGTASWHIHDCRRTWRTLASRCNINSEIAEMTLGHVVGGVVRQTYDKFKYVEQKRHALATVAALIERILLDAPATNIVALREAAP
jgi:integrase